MVAWRSLVAAMFLDSLPIRQAWRLARQRRTRPQSSSSKNHIISHFTDVEGDRDYLERYVARSEVLCFRPSEDRNFPYDEWMDFQDSNGMLVFGGDVCDQGGSDLYCIRQLLSLKDRHPDRVHLLLGNRDLNKLRVTQELGLEGDECPPHKGVYWLRGSGLEGDPALGPVTTDPTQRLKWMLKNTMGSPQAFEHRRWELRQERSLKVATDEDVVESYRDACRPGGELSRYLAHGVLALRLGDVLFIHGALPLTEYVVASHPTGLWDDFRFAMPWLPSNVTSAKDVGVHNVDDWISSLNEFARTCIVNFEENNGTGIWSETGGYHVEGQPFAPLIQYGMGWTPDRQRNPTVVYQSWSSDGMPRRFFSDREELFVRYVKEFFRQANVSLMVCGHQPQGDMPNTIRLDLENRTAWIVSADTSYSGDTSWYGEPVRRNRGRGTARSGRGDVAVSEILIEQCPTTGTVVRAFAHGVLSDGTEYETLPLAFGASLTQAEQFGQLASGEAPASKDTPHGQPWWRRAVLTDGSLLLSSGQGYDATNCLLPGYYHDSGP